MQCCILRYILRSFLDNLWIRIINLASMSQVQSRYPAIQEAAKFCIMTQAQQVYVHSHSQCADTDKVYTCCSLPYVVLFSVFHVA
jgi:hypothetical protein